MIWIQCFETNGFKPMDWIHCESDTKSLWTVLTLKSFANSHWVKCHFLFFVFFRFLNRVEEVKPFAESMSFGMFLSRPETTFVEGRKEVEEQFNKLTEEETAAVLTKLFPDLSEEPFDEEVYSEIFYVFWMLNVPGSFWDSEIQKFLNFWNFGFSDILKMKTFLKSEWKRISDLQRILSVLLYFRSRNVPSFSISENWKCCWLETDSICLSIWNSLCFLSVFKVLEDDVPKLKEFLTKIDGQMSLLHKSAVRLFKHLNCVSKEMASFTESFDGLYNAESNYPYKATSERLDVREQFSLWSTYQTTQTDSYYDNFLRSLRYGIWFNDFDAFWSFGKIQDFWSFCIFDFV